MKVMTTMKNNNILDNEDRHIDLEEKDWERYVQLFENKKIRDEEKKEKDEIRDKLQSKFEQNKAKMEKASR